MVSVKDAARQLIEQLPEQATWDGILHESYVKQKIRDQITVARKKAT